MSEPGLLTLWAETLLDALAEAGVTDVIASPGSRSTPFLLAAVGHPRLRCHHVIDERAAAFFALGHARVTARPALLLCTSGTAGAHYLPAVIEAAHAHLPLLVLTADRPPELHGCGASQTIDQTRLYGEHARRFVDLGLPDGSLGAFRALRRTAAQAVFAALHPLPGAVHLNARAKKPLEPIAPSAELAALAHAACQAPLPRPAAPPPRPDAAALADVAAACRRARRGLIVCGPAPLAQTHAREAVATLARATGFPILAETTSQLRTDSLPGACPAFDHLFADEGFAATHAPDLVLQLGAAPISSAWERALARHLDAELVIIAPHGWPDPGSRSRHVLVAGVAETAHALAAALAGHPPEPGAWTASFARADRAAWRAVDRVLAENPLLTEGAVTRATLASVPEGGLFAIGNSLPVRHVDRFARTAPAHVLSQRGAAGIDGLVAGAAGAASAANAPVTLLLGDISLLHDLGGLALAQRLRIVVLHNDGGRIFEELPLAQTGHDLTPFTTPHGADLGHAARLFGLRHARASTRAELTAALAEPQHGLLIEAIVPPHGAAEELARVRAAVATELAADLGAAS